ncbi:TonB-dependent receptor [Emticicia agri]|uniref:TonB-dependent receptor n=1 Tax=Emticicia agri TaxID=2492393 RepID=A0A4Q5LW32_9BACT|nr:TonB-dependent receptor [Emticicia agri]RYU93769.1 TonB-dependent receptor [Emticicia agri]
MNKLAILFIFIFFSKSFGQTTRYNISGFVTDANTGEALIGASVFEEHSKAGQFTNKYGYFVLSLNQKSAQLKISFIGYESTILSINLNKDSTIYIALSPKEQALEEVIVKTTEQQKLQRTPIGVTSIPVARLKEIPILFGESDILKALAMTPGVSTGNEGTSGLLVRGGSPDQNLILIDDATVYNASHLFGLVSIFNTDAIKNVSLYKAGFPAQYGGRLSSVLDISMKEGNNRKKKQELTIGLIGSKILFEGPLSQKYWGKSSYMVSARTSTLTPILLPAIIAFKLGKAENSFNYWLYDINAKINHQINKKTQVFASIYHGNDFLISQDGLVNDRGKVNLNWGNLISSVRLNYIIHPKVFLKAIGSFSDYHYTLGSTSYQKENTQWKEKDYLFNTSSIRDWSGKASVEWFPLSFYQIKFGLEATNHLYTPTSLRTSQPVFTDSLKKITAALTANEYSVFIENELNFTKWLSTNIGLRQVFYRVRNNTFNRLEPRVSANILLPQHIAIKGGYSQMNQFIHLLSSNGVGFPNDVWVPSTDNIGPSNSEMFSVGLTKSFPKQHIELTIEAYKKDFRNLIDYADGKNLFSNFNTSWENLIEKNGIGRVKGLEFFLNKAEGVLNGWIAYTYAKNERKFTNINDGNWYAANFDRRHIIAIVLNYKPENGRSSFNVSWNYQSGQPTTVPIALARYFLERDFTLGGSVIEIYGNRNNYRMPAYHRLDISYSFQWTTRRHRDATLSLGIYNAYNRHNAYYLKTHWQPYPFATSDSIKGIENKLYQVGIIPFLPFVSYSLKLR